MGWATVAVGVVTAAAGAYSAKQQAKAANKSKTSVTDGTQVTQPWMPAQDYLYNILDEQKKIYDQGPPDWSKIYGGGGGGPITAGQDDINAAKDIYHQIADAGLNAGNTPGMQLGYGAMQDIWGGADGSGAGTGYQGYNPILDQLTQDMQGALDPQVAQQLLMDFAAQNQGGQLDPSGGGGGMSGWTIGGLPGAMVMGGGGGVLPDTGAGNGTFQRELDRIFSEEANDEEIAALLDSMAGDLERQKFSAMADMEAQAAGAGRTGSGWHAARIADANARYAEELSQASAQLRYGDLEARRQAKINALGLLNNRDISAMQDMTSRAGIGASSASAAAGRSLQAQIAELQHSGLLRGQDLEALLAIQGGQQFNANMLAGLGGQLSSDRMGTLGMIPQYETLGLQGLGLAQGAAQGIQGIGDAAAAREQAQRQRAASQRQQAAVAQAQAQQRMLDDYLRTVGVIGSMGSHTYTHGTNMQPGAGISTGAAALQGGIGGFMAGYGTYNNLSADYDAYKQGKGGG